MTTLDKSSAAFFEEKYRATGDPWQYETSSYESQKYDATLAALSYRRYLRAFEPGCSIGVLTARLAGICDFVQASDFSCTAIERARARCAPLNNVQLECQDLQSQLPVRDFDLIVLSEIGYYFEPGQWRAVLGEIIVPAEPGTSLIGVHWLGHSPDHCMNGSEVQDIIQSSPLLQLQHSERHPRYRLDRWCRI